MQPGACLNCDQPFTITDRFCSQCGQTAHLHRLNMHYVLHEGAHFLTHTDKSIFSLIGKLAYKPGYVARDFIEGKRKRYLSPLNFYLIIIGIFVLVLSTFKTFEQPNNFAQWRAGTQRIPDRVERTRKLMKIDRAEDAAHFMSKHSNLVSLLAATPLASFILFLFYRKRGFNYTEHLVANFYFAGFSALFFIFIVAPVINIFQSNAAYLGAIAAFLLFEWLYRSIAYYQLMNRKGAKSYFYALLASGVAVGCWIFLSRMIIILYIDTGFKFF